MVWVVPNEGLNLGQVGGERRAVDTAVAEEAEASLVERPDLGPLLQVTGRWRLECAPHLVDRPKAAGTDCLELGARRDLEALAADEACVGDQVWRRTATQSLWSRRMAVTGNAPEGHTPRFLDCSHAGPHAGVTPCRGEASA